MIRQVPRCIFRAPIPSFRPTPTRRFLSTAPPAQQSRSWKSKATRLGLAVGVIYYYNTSPLFAEEPPCSPPLTRLQFPETNNPRVAVPPPNAPSDETSLQTLESVRSNHEKPNVPPTPPPESTESETLEEREQQASQEGAFNEETGEINWDCSCLGGMAHGPCGEQFRGAFSCFVFSKAEPKGMDCIENFKTMQDCFREHPDIYGSELEEDDAPPEEGAPSPSPAPLPDAGDGLIPAAATSATPESQPPPLSSSDPSASVPGTSDTERAQAAKQQVESDHGEPISESDEMVPKAAHDATNANAAK